MRGIITASSDVIVIVTVLVIPLHFIQPGTLTTSLFLNVHCVPKVVLYTKLVAITLLILNGFSKLFHCWKAM